MVAAPRPVALYLDTFLSPELMDRVVDICRAQGADLLFLAPQPGGLATSRLEPHLVTLAHAGVEWDLRLTAGELSTDLSALPEVSQLVCERGSALARYLGKLPAPLLILLNPETRPTSPAPDATPEVDWLAPRFNRGF